MQNTENSAYCYREAKESDTNEHNSGKIIYGTNNIYEENNNKLSEDIYVKKPEHSQANKSEMNNVSNFSMGNSCEEDYNFDDIIKNVAKPEGKQRSGLRNKRNKIEFNVNEFFCDFEFQNFLIWLFYFFFFCFFVFLCFCLLCCFK